MISNRNIHFALLCASSLLRYMTPGRASATSSASSTSPAAFTFPSCVESCVNVSGCGTDNPQCMCKFSGKGIFLELVLTCMSYYCEAELRRTDDTLIDIMEAGCQAIRQPIAEEKLEMAEAWASRLVKDLPASPTIATTTVHHPLPTTATTLVTSIQPPPPVTATTTHVPPPPSTIKPTVVQTTLESSSLTSTSATASAPESTSRISTATTLQPQTSSTKPADEAATSAPAPKPRPDSSPYGPFVGPIPSSAVMAVMVSLPFLHWVSTLVYLAVAGILFA